MKVTTTTNYAWTANQQPSSCQVKTGAQEQRFQAGDGQVESFMPGSFRSLDQLDGLLSPKNGMKLKGYQMDRCEFPTYNAPMKVELGGQTQEAVESCEKGFKSYTIQSEGQSIVWTPGQGVELTTSHNIDGVQIDQTITGRSDGDRFLLAAEALQTEG